jgi:hypothetical protein
MSCTKLGCTEDNGTWREYVCTCKREGCGQHVFKCRIWGCPIFVPTAGSMCEACYATNMTCKGLQGNSRVLSSCVSSNNPQVSPFDPMCVVCKSLYERIVEAWGYSRPNPPQPGSQCRGVLNPKGLSLYRCVGDGDGTCLKCYELVLKVLQNKSQRDQLAFKSKK